MPVSVSIVTALVILLIITKSRAVINSNSYDVTANRELERSRFHTISCYRRNVHILLS